MLDLVRTLPDWAYGCLGLFGLVCLYGAEGRRRERRAARPRVHLLGTAATHPRPDVQARQMTAARIAADMAYIRRWLAAADPDSGVDTGAEGLGTTRPGNGTKPEER